MTVRLSEQLAAELAAVAAVDDVPAAEIIRSAIAQHIRRRVADPAFRVALEQHVARQQAMLAMLDRP
jgi:predicted transcriptional regulator